MLLKDLGAEVIKVEIPGSGDATRTLPPQTEGGESYTFINLNRGKKSITLNLASERGREIARELVEKANVVAENFNPRVMDKLGLGYKELSKINPQLIYASVSGFGHTGPRSSEPGFDTIAQAMGGLMSITGFPDGPPTRTGVAIADFLGGINATISILAALVYRKETGKGQMIDISLQDGIWALAAIDGSPGYFLTGEIPQRLGNGVVNSIPFRVYPAKDGDVVICVVTVGQWQTFLRVIGREDLLEVQKYATQKERVNYRDEIDAIVEEWTKTRTVEEVLNTLGDAHLACSSVPTIDKVANDPHLLSRGMVIEVEQLISGKLKVPGSVFKLSETPGDVSFPSPFLGQHNYEVYSELLGYGEQEITKLVNDGII